MFDKGRKDRLQGRRGRYADLDAIDGLHTSHYNFTIVEYNVRHLSLVSSGRLWDLPMPPCRGPLVMVQFPNMRAITKEPEEDRRSPSRAVIDLNVIRSATTFREKKKNTASVLQRQSLWGGGGRSFWSVRALYSSLLFYAVRDPQKLSEMTANNVGKTRVVEFHLIFLFFLT